MRLLVAVVLAAAAAHAAETPKAEPGIRYLYLIRHGMYDRVPDVNERVGNGLNTLGHEQAVLVGKRLAALPVHMSALVTSDYTRARETAVDMGKELGMTPAQDSLLRECTPTTTRADLVKENTPAEFAACEANLEAAWAKYVRPSPERDTHEVLVCHGNVIRWFVTRAIGADSKRWWSMDIGNASLTVIAVRPDGTTRLVVFSDVGHLPVASQTWTGRGAGWASPSAR
jgi:serine/threonine-protein phosphatase PGAM5